MKSLNEIAVVVQARYNSERVPFKMSQGINDYPFASTSLLDIVLEKLTKSEVIQNEHIYLSVHEEGLIQIGEKYPINIHKRSWESANVDSGIDVLFDEMKKENTSNEILVAFSEYLIQESYDSDSLEIDILTHSQGSNILNSIRGSRLRAIITEWIYEMNCMYFFCTFNRV